MSEETRLEEYIKYARKLIREEEKRRRRMQAKSFDFLGGYTLHAENYSPGELKIVFRKPAPYVKIEPKVMKVSLSKKGEEGDGCMICEKMEGGIKKEEE